MSCVARRHGLSFDSGRAADMLALALTLATAILMIVWRAHEGKSVTVSRLGPHSLPFVD